MSQSSDSCGLLLYAKYPPYGRFNFVGPANVVIASLYRGIGRSFELAATTSTRALDWHLASRVVEAPPDVYELWISAGWKNVARAPVRLAQGDLYVVFVEAHHVGLLRRLFQRQRTTRIYHGRVGTNVLS